MLDNVRCMHTDQILTCYTMHSNAVKLYQVEAVRIFSRSQG